MESKVEVDRSIAFAGAKELAVGRRWRPQRGTDGEDAMFVVSPVEAEEIPTEIAQRARFLQPWFRFGMADEIFSPGKIF